MAKQTLLMKMVDFLDIQQATIDISETSNTVIINKYYQSIGVTDTTTMNEWFEGIISHKYPAYTSVSRAIRKTRELNPQWQKPYTNTKPKDKSWFKSIFN